MEPPAGGEDSCACENLMWMKLGAESSRKEVEKYCFLELGGGTRTTKGINCQFRIRQML